jgi:hypothetical protein
MRARYQFKKNTAFYLRPRPRDCVGHAGVTINSSGDSHSLEITHDPDYIS